MSTGPAITFHDLTLGYDRHPAVHHIGGEVDKGELLALVGPNGAGKSTLLKGIVGELKPLGGSLSLHGLEKRDIAYLPQQIDIELDGCRRHVTNPSLRARRDGLCTLSHSFRTGSTLPKRLLWCMSLHLAHTDGLRRCSNPTAAGGRADQQ